MKKNRSTTPSTFSCSRTLLSTQNVPARPMGVLVRKYKKIGGNYVDSRGLQLEDLVATLYMYIVHVATCMIVCTICS